MARPTSAAHHGEKLARTAQECNRAHTAEQRATTPAAARKAAKWGARAQVRNNRAWRQAHRDWQARNGNWNAR